MENYAIYAYNTPDDVDFVYKSLVEDHVSRFFWSYREDCDLRKLNEMSWNQMDNVQIDCWKHAHRLLDFKQGDWILHINVPRYGMVTAARILGDYYYDNDLPKGHNDGRHCFKIDRNTIIEFDRNDSRVHSYLSARLKLQRALWRIYCVEHFEKSLKELKEAAPTDKNVHFIKETNQVIENFTKVIQSNYPGKKLEYFLAEVFKQIPEVLEVKVNGSQWGTDYGADIIVTYAGSFYNCFAIEPQTLVVQVKSFEGNHWDTKAVDQLKTAISKYEATMGLILTTGERTQELEKKFEELENELNVSHKNVPIYLLAGIEVAQFVLKNGMDILLDSK